MTFAAMLLGDRVLRNPITGIARCCACAASGHAADNPVIPAMKSRRRITLPSLGYRQFRLPTEPHQNRYWRPVKCDEMVSLHCTNLEPQMTEMGQKEHSPFGPLCQLWPAADITPNRASSALCHDRTNCTAANSVPIGKQDRRIIRDLSKENAYCRVASPRPPRLA